MRTTYNSRVHFFRKQKAALSMPSSRGGLPEIPGAVFQIAKTCARPFGMRDSENPKHPKMAKLFWVIPSMFWLIPSMCWVIPSMCWVIPIMFWVIPSMFWVIPSVFWVITLLFWDTSLLYQILVFCI